MFLSRAEVAGKDGTSLYLRRVVFLLLLGFAHALLLWPGDILNAYAMMGLFLILTRHWAGWRLLVIGSTLTLFSTIVDRLVWEHLVAAPGAPLLYQALMEPGAVRRMAIFMGHDYGAFVRENVRGLWGELYATSTGLAYLGWIFGRFLIGSWLHRRGWVQDAARYARGFRLCAAILIPAGIILAGIGPIFGIFDLQPANELGRISLHFINRSAQIILALGYAAGLVVLMQNPCWQRRLSGLGTAGRMALTNYLVQSLVYFFLLYGFGAGLLRYTAPAFALGLAIAFIMLQIAFSRWWLGCYQFGPAEWVWRCWTYGGRQPMRLRAKTRWP